jgi:hypothetical protein
VVKEVFVEKVEPHRLAVSDEMDAVAFEGQGFAQLGGHHAGAAEGGVTDNADVHIKMRLRLANPEASGLF